MARDIIEEESLAERLQRAADECKASLYRVIELRAQLFSDIAVKENVITGAKKDLQYPNTPYEKKIGQLETALLIVTSYELNDDVKTRVVKPATFNTTDEVSAFLSELAGAEQKVTQKIEQIHSRADHQYNNQSAEDLLKKNAELSELNILSSQCRTLQVYLKEIALEDMIRRFEEENRVQNIKLQTVQAAEEKLIHFRDVILPKAQQWQNLSPLNINENDLLKEISEGLSAAGRDLHTYVAWQRNLCDKRTELEKIVMERLEEVLSHMETLKESTPRSETSPSTGQSEQGTGAFELAVEALGKIRQDKLEPRAELLNTAMPAADQFVALMQVTKRDELLARLLSMFGQNRLEELGKELARQRAHVVELQGKLGEAQRQKEPHEGDRELIDRLTAALGEAEDETRIVSDEKRALEERLEILARELKEVQLVNERLLAEAKRTTIPSFPVPIPEVQEGAPATVPAEDYRRVEEALRLERGLTARLMAEVSGFIEATRGYKGTKRFVSGMSAASEPAELLAQPEPSLEGPITERNLPVVSYPKEALSNDGQPVEKSWWRSAVGKNSEFARFMTKSDWLRGFYIKYFLPFDQTTASDARFMKKNRRVERLMRKSDR